MNIIFEYSDKKLILPVNPDRVSVKKPSQSQKVEVIGIGEVSVPQKRKLATISINSFFWEDLFNQNFLLAGLGAVSGYVPSVLSNQINSGVRSGINSVKGFVNSVPKSDIVQATVSSIIDDSQKFKVLNEYVKWFEEWQASKKPARWTIVVPPNQPPQCFDFYVTCANFEYEVRAGEDGDYYYNLELLEWRDYGAKVLNTKTQKDGTVVYEKETSARIDTNKPETPTEITATDKDSIWSISKRYCQDNWRDLFNEEVNRVALSTSPQDISGAVLKIPKQYISRIGS